MNPEIDDAPPLSGEATLLVRRLLPKLVKLTELGNKFRTYRVMLDGVQIGRLAREEAGEFAISPGTHTLRLAIDWTGSEVVTFTAEPGDTVRFTCQQKPGLPMLHTFTRHGWILLRPEGEAP